MTKLFNKPIPGADTPCTMELQSQQDTHTLTQRLKSLMMLVTLMILSVGNAWGGQYTITFDASSNGTCSTSSLTQSSDGASITLPAASANSNYVFTGWFNSSSVRIGSSGDTYIPTANETLTAHYTTLSGTYIDASTGEVASATTTIRKGETWKFTFNNFGSLTYNWNVTNSYYEYGSTWKSWAFYAKGTADSNPYKLNSGNWATGTSNESVTTTFSGDWNNYMNALGNGAPVEIVTKYTGTTIEVTATTTYNSSTATVSNTYTSMADAESISAYVTQNNAYLTNYTATLVNPAAPTFSPAEGTYTSAQTLTLSSATDGASVYYTTDGNDPTSSSNLYDSNSKPTVSESTTFKAIAIKDGYNSDITIATYTITSTTVAAPTFSIESGTSIRYGDKLTVTSATEGSTIYGVFDTNEHTADYIKNNSHISGNSTFEFAPNATGTWTLQTVAVNGDNISEVSTLTFTVNPIVTYDANGATGGSVPTDENSYASGASVTVKGNLNTLYKTGYIFEGWNTAADGSGTTYKANETFTINGNTTLYAKWSTALKTVNFTGTDCSISSLKETIPGQSIYLPGAESSTSVTISNETSNWTGSTGKYGDNTYVERYTSSGAISSGDVLTQTLTLKNGTYEVVMSVAASYTAGRGFTANTGNELAKAFAGDKEMFIPVVDRSWVNQGEENQVVFVVNVTTGSLAYGIKNVADGGNWYIAKVESVKKLSSTSYYVWYDAATGGNKKGNTGAEYQIASSGETLYAQSISRCAAPTFSPDGSTHYTTTQTVSISCATEGTTIYYTQDGTDPTSASTQYSGSITLVNGNTIKAIAIKEGYGDSEIVTTTFTFDVIGNTDCSTAYPTVFSDPISISSGKTRHITFHNVSKGEANYQNFYILAKGNDTASDADNYFRLRADNWDDIATSSIRRMTVNGVEMGNDGDNGTGATNWSYFRTDMTSGADVDMYVSYNGSKFYINASWTVNSRKYILTEETSAISCAATPAYLFLTVQKAYLTNVSVYEEVDACTVTMVASPEAGGTIAMTNSNGMTVNSGTAVQSGEAITFTATANDGYRFSSWSDGTTNTSATKTITVNTEFTATFKNTKDITLRALVTENSIKEMVLKGTYQISVTATDVDGNTISGLTYTYTSSNTTYLTVSDAGLITAVKKTGDDAMTITVSFAGNDSYNAASVVIDGLSVVDFAGPSVTYANTDDSGALIIHAPSAGVTYYTTDGSAPTTSSSQITAGASLNIEPSTTTQVVNCITIDTGTSQKSRILTSYVFGTNTKFFRLEEADEDATVAMPAGYRVNVKDASNNTLVYVTYGDTPRGGNKILFPAQKHDGRMIQSDMTPFIYSSVANYDGMTELNYPQNQETKSGTVQNGNRYDPTISNNPFNIPIDGSYGKIEPKVDGTFSIAFRQNGCTQYISGGETLDPSSFKARYVCVCDETGTVIPAGTESGTVRAYISPNAKVDKQYATITDAGTTMYTSEPETFKTVYGYETDFSSDDKTSMEAGTYPNALVNYKNYGWALKDRAHVVYTFDVKAGKTYFIVGVMTKIGPEGFFFEPAASTTSENKTLDTSSSETKTNSWICEGNKGKHYNVTLNRPFKKDVWTTLVLPFSVSPSQVQEQFGDESNDAVMVTNSDYETNHATIVHFDYVNNSNLYLKRHYHQMIVAGTPILIRPRKDVTNPVFTNVVLQDVSSAPYMDMTTSTSDESSRDTGWQLTGKYDSPATIPTNSYYIGYQLSGETVVEGSNKVYRATQDRATRGTVAWFKNTVSAGAKLLGMGFGSYDEQDEDDVTAIDDVPLDEGVIRYGSADIYNLNGQMVRTHEQGTAGLPAGIYIVNGKKVIIK